MTHAHSSVGHQTMSRTRDEPNSSVVHTLLLVAALSDTNAVRFSWTFAQRCRYWARAQRALRPSGPATRIARSLRSSSSRLATRFARLRVTAGVSKSQDVHQSQSV